MYIVVHRNYLNPPLTTIIIDKAMVEEWLERRRIVDMAQFLNERKKDQNQSIISSFFFIKMMYHFTKELMKRKYI